MQPRDALCSVATRRARCAAAVRLVIARVRRVLAAVRGVHVSSAAAIDDLIITGMGPAKASTPS